MINFDKRLFFIFKELSMNVVSKIDSHARYYDPRTGRWISPDPIHFKGGDTNLYRYVENNPIKYTDPYGTLSPASVTACALMFTAGEIWDVYSGIKDLMRLRDEAEKKLEALAKEKKTCNETRKLEIWIEEQAILKSFQMSSMENILGVFVPGVGGAAALTGCLISIGTF